MRIAVAVGGFGLDARWNQRRDRRGRLLMRLLWRFTRRAPETLESVVSRSVDQAFAEFAEEMAA